MIRGLDEEPVLVGVIGIAGVHGWLFVLGRQAGTRSRVPDELILKDNIAKGQPGPHSCNSAPRGQ